MTNFVLINPFEVPEDVDDDRFLEGWGRRPTTCGRAPASSRPASPRGVAESKVPLRERRRVGVPAGLPGGRQSPEFQAMAAGTPPNHPALYEVVRVV
jgi:hypothetical protein